MSASLRIVRELLFPPKCLGCGQRLRLSLDQSKTPWFCEDCAVKWERCKLFQCPTCFGAYCDCTCQPYIMKRAGSAAFLKLAPYGDSDELRLVGRLVNDCKRYPNIRGFLCCAEELLPALEKSLLETEEKQPFSRTVIAHLPRSHRNARKYGLDQAQRLAKALARLSGIPYLHALKRVHDGVEQKELKTGARAANVKGAFALQRSVKGARVILVDDVVTTGAGMAEAIRVLRKGGAACVIAVSVAATRKIK